jgi:hypothetical protein
MKILLAVAVMSLLAPVANAQTGSAPSSGNDAVQSGISKNPGLGEDKPKERTSIGESNAVGSIGNQKAGEQAIAPALQKDCTRNPAECSEPLTTGATPTPGMPQQSKE